MAGAVCFWAVTSIKPRLRYDDSLDVWGVHGVGGIIGTLATGIFAFGPLSATADHPTGTATAGAALLLIQATGVLATLIWAGVMSAVLLKLTDLLVGLRVSRDDEREGLDIVLHGEQVF